MAKQMSMNKLAELFKKKDLSDDPIPESELIGYTDKCNIVMLIPKTRMTKRFIQDNFDVDEQKIPTFDYPESNRPCRISTEFMGLIVSIMNIENPSDGFGILAIQGQPLMIETKHLKCYIAPRVDYDN